MKLNFSDTRSQGYQTWTFLVKYWWFLAFSQKIWGTMCHFCLVTHQIMTFWPFGKNMSGMAILPFSPMSSFFSNVKYSMHSSHWWKISKLYSQNFPPFIDPFLGPWNILWWDIDKWIIFRRFIISKFFWYIYRFFIFCRDFWSIIGRSSRLYSFIYRKKAK